mgnify:CR=1 FL=1
MLSSSCYAESWKVSKVKDSWGQSYKVAMIKNNNYVFQIETLLYTFGTLIVPSNNLYINSSNNSVIFQVDHKPAFKSAEVHAGGKEFDISLTDQDISFLKEGNVLKIEYQIQNGTSTIVTFSLNNSFNALSEIGL